MTSSPLAFTTPFTPPPPCTTQTWWWNDTRSLVVSGTTATLQYWSLGSTNEASCFPSGWKSATDTYFSPGRCPGGYTLACSRNLQPTEMAGTCCPTGYSCQIQASWPYESDHPCTHSTWNNEIVSYLYIGQNNAVQTGTTGLYMGLNAKGVSIRWNPNELAPSTATSGSSTGTSTGKSSPTDASSSTSSPSSDHGISGGAIAGAVVGSVLGVLLAVGLVSLFFISRRRKRQPAPHFQDEKYASQTAPTAGSAPVHEAGNGAVHEIGPDAGGRPPSYIHELPASSKSP